MIYKILEVKNSYQEFLASLSWEHNHGWEQFGKEKTSFRTNGLQLDTIYSQTLMYRGI